MLSYVIKLKKGLDIPLKGGALPFISKVENGSSYAISPLDFEGLTPKLAVKIGDKVIVGDPLFHDKKNPEILFTAPVSGEVSHIVRGAKRRIESIVVTKADKEEDVFKDFGVKEQLKRFDFIRGLPVCKTQANGRTFQICSFIGVVSKFMGFGDIFIH